MAAEPIDFFRANRSSRAPVRLTMERSDIVGRLMDYQVAIEVALLDGGAARQYAMQAAQDPRNHGAFDAARVLRDQSRGLRGLLDALRIHTGELDGLGGTAA